MSIIGLYKTSIDICIKNNSIRRKEEFYCVFKRLSHSLFQCGRIKVYIGIYKDDREKYNGIIYLDDLYDYKVYIDHSGYYKLKIKEIRYYDLFQCFFIKRKFEDEYEFYVLPEYRDIDEYIESINNDNDSDCCSNDKGNDYNEIYDIHEYREGDYLRRIHWKISLKRNELYIAEGSMPLYKKIYLSVRQCSHLDRNDFILDMFYSLCLYYLNNNIEFYVVFSNECKCINHIDQLRDCILLVLKNNNMNSYCIKNESLLLINESGIEVIHL